MKEQQTEKDPGDKDITQYRKLTGEDLKGLENARHKNYRD